MQESDKVAKGPKVTQKVIKKKRLLAQLKRF